MEVTHVGWRVEGVAFGECWDGTLGDIDMTPYRISNLTRDAVAAGVNDGGFGFQRILGATYHIIELFTHNATEYLGMEEFAADELVNAKRGI